MPTPGDSQYVSQTSDLSNVRQFVEGFQARNAQSTRNGLRALAVGVVTSAVIRGAQTHKARKRAGR